MAKSFFISSIILLCTSIIEAAILSNITLLPSIPDLSLICVLFFSLKNGSLIGETTGFISGFFLDCLSACPFGLNSLYRTVLGFIGGIFNKRLNSNGIIIPALLGCIATLVKALFLWSISFLFPHSVIAYNPFSQLFLFELGVNTILTPIIFKFLSLFSNYILLKPEQII